MRLKPFYDDYTSSDPFSEDELMELSRKAEEYANQKMEEKNKEDFSGDYTPESFPYDLDFECPFCSSNCSQVLTCPCCRLIKGLECCMPNGIGFPCISCQESEEYGE